MKKTDKHTTAYFFWENAEAYFSSDGESLIFQSHNGDTLCDQIYIMKIKTREKVLVSTGNGVTTCAYFEHPDVKTLFILLLIWEI